MKALVAMQEHNKRRPGGSSGSSGSGGSGSSGGSGGLGSSGGSGGCIEGELVWMVEPCPWSLRDPDGPCPCARTFRGMFTDGTTTAAVVRDIEGMTRAEYISAMTPCDDERPECTCGIEPAEVVDELIRLVRGVAEGTVFTRRVGLVEMESM